ncbi:MAG: 2-oxo acid dehydrogenase subunit E2 [Betaproteobacteria bacterium]|nr:2-oxo acid dehydrogenase subunit E2 [Betaproteobacteria bacterium]
MGIHVIRMPDIGEGIAEVELVEWYVKPGDPVAEDQVLADVMTDKATVEIPSPVAGTVLALGGKLGEVMAVGSELIRIEVAGAGNVKDAPAASVGAPGVPEAGSAATTAAPVANVPAAPAVTPAPRETSATPPTQPPVPRAAPPQPKPRATAAGSAPPPRLPGDKPVASPAVRRRAWDMGIELQFVHGSGTAGRITHEDLDAYAARAPAAQSPAADARYAERNDEEAVPVIGLRRKIAQKMQEAKRRIPHFTYVEEIDVTELEALRAQLNAKWGLTRGKLTLLPLLARAIVMAVREYPQVNALFDDDNGVLTRHGAVHIGIATQTDGGLLVPVLRHAEARDLWSTAAEIARLAEATRTAKATREELAGSTITITSLGALGGIVTTPVINHPEVAIVGVNRIVERPMIRGGTIVPRQMMNLSSSFDHRVVDGAVAARFVQAIRGMLECPATLFVE